MMINKRYLMISSVIFGLSLTYLQANEGLMSRYTFDKFAGIYEEDSLGNGDRLKIDRTDQFRLLSKRTVGLMGNGVLLLERGAMKVELPKNVTDKFTISFFYRANAYDTNSLARIDGLFDIDINNSGYLVFNKSVTKLVLPKDTFVNISVVYDNLELSIYLNGVLGTKIKRVEPFINKNTIFYIGKLGQAHRVVNGVVDELRIYNQPLDSQKLEALSNVDKLKSENLPIADAGVAQTAWLEQSKINLNGRAVNADEFEWRILQAPPNSKAKISSPTQLKTQVTLDKVGDYIFELTAKNQNNISKSKVRAVLFESMKKSPAKSFVGKLKAGELHQESYMNAKEPVYSQAFRDKYFPEPKFETMDQGFDKKRVGTAPNPYIHPRIFFGPENLNAIRERLKYTNAGQANYEKILSLIECRKMNEKRYPFQVAILADTKSRSAGDSYEFAAVLNDLALVALVEADSELARQLIDIMVEQADIQLKLINDVPPNKANDWQGYFHHVLGRTMTPYMYDFLYPWMTESERAKIRNVIAQATQDKWVIGMNSVSGSGRSNWLCWMAGDMLQAVTAIEGEEGFPVEVYKELVNAYKNWMTNGIFQTSGAAFEGMGKNSMTAQNLLILNRRGENLLNSKGAYNHVTKFMAGTLQPYGYQFIQDDLWGGSRKNYHYSDVVVMKYAYPNDPVIDFVFRNIGQDDYRNWETRGTTYRYNFEFLPLIFGTDYIGDTDYRKNMQEAMKDASLDYYSSDINLITSRSAWTPEASYVYFLPRMLGGHNSPARSTFIYSALGRDWTIYPTGYNDRHALQHSVVTIDGENQFPDYHTKLVAYEPKENLVTATCDLQYVYSGDAPSMMSYNDYRLAKNPNRWESIPEAKLPHWFNGNRPSAPLVSDKIYKNKVHYAYRTLGFVRNNPHDYLVVADDFKKDDKEHDYRWQIVLPPDLTDIQVDKNKAIIVDPTSKNKLYVVALDSQAQFKVENGYETKHEQPFKSLSYTVKAKEFHSKVILIPLKSGETLPVIDNGKITFADGSINRIKFNTKDNYTTIER